MGDNDDNDDKAERARFKEMFDALVAKYHIPSQESLDKIINLCRSWGCCEMLKMFNILNKYEQERMAEEPYALRHILRIILEKELTLPLNYCCTKDLAKHWLVSEMRLTFDANEAPWFRERWLFKAKPYAMIKVINAIKEKYKHKFLHLCIELADHVMLELTNEKNADGSEKEISSDNLKAIIALKTLRVNLSEEIEQERDKQLGTPKFTYIRTNKYFSQPWPLSKEELLMVKEPCACPQNCANRCDHEDICVECTKTCLECTAYSCANRRFQNREYAKCSPFQTPWKGWGLKADEKIPKDTFIIEYVGEVIDIFEKHRRMRQQALDKTKFYLMDLNEEETIDSTVKANKSRFINHSCDPNARTETWIVTSRKRIGLFAKKDIAQDEEITFDYNCDKEDKKLFAEDWTCYCGTAKCRFKNEQQGTSNSSAKQKGAAGKGTSNSSAKQKGAAGKGTSNSSAKQKCAATIDPRDPKYGGKQSAAQQKAMDIKNANAAKKTPPKKTPPKKTPPKKTPPKKTRRKKTTPTKTTVRRKRKRSGSSEDDGRAAKKKRS